MDVPEQKAEPVLAKLNLWDAVSIIIGIIIGATIYETPPLIYQNVSSVWMAMGVWVLGGVLSLFGALTYAELATAYPRTGGDYVYLTRAYGSWMGFLFGWAQLTVIHTGAIGMLAYIFADYCVRLLSIQGAVEFEKNTGAIIAATAVLVLTGLNVLGVVLGKITQNILTVAKIIGLGGILVAGFFWSQAPTVTAPASSSQSPSFGFAMVLIFLAFSGYNDAAYVAAEVKRQRRNMPLALIIGTGGCTVIYLLINAAYLHALGFDGARRSDAIAADVLKLALGKYGETAMCVLVMVSVLGGINGSIFTGSRIFAKMGAEHRVFGWMGHWSHQTGSPIIALCTQAIVCLIMILGVGTEPGQEALNQLFSTIGLTELSWKGRGGFETLLKFTTPIFWLFFLFTSLSLFVLRERDRDIPRPFTVPLYPLAPLLFTGTCVYMLHSGMNYAGQLGLIGSGLLVIGLLLYFVSGERTSSDDTLPEVS